MPPPLPYFKVSIYPFPLPHFASIFFAYLWSFRWPNYIVTVVWTRNLLHLNEYANHYITDVGGVNRGFDNHICGFIWWHFINLSVGSFRWPNYIVTLPRYFSFRLPHLNIPTRPPSDELDKNIQRTSLLYRYTPEIILFSTATFKYTYRAPLRRIGLEYSANVASFGQEYSANVALSTFHWIFHMHSEFSRPAMCNNAIMIISNILCIMLKIIIFFYNNVIPQALVSFKKYMPPPLSYFKVNICPFPFPHFASIFFAYLHIIKNQFYWLKDNHII
jgi:hypothetical protein